LSCYGRPDYTTPVLDGLAAEGVMLSQGYANSAVCSATRVALVTGRYQYRLRVGLEEPIAGSDGFGLPRDHPTLPSFPPAIPQISQRLLGGIRTLAFEKYLKSGSRHAFANRIRGSGCK
jgi:hypothetical protein